MILFLHGTDDFAVNERRKSLQKAFGKKYPAGEIFVFDFKERGTIEEVGRALAAGEAGLFEAQKMVVWLHPFELDEHISSPLLEFFEKNARKTGKAVVLLVVSYGKTSKAHPLARFLAKRADKEEILDRSARSSPPAVVRRALSRIDAQASFTHEALQLFLDTIGNDSGRMHTELMKLSAFKPGGVFGAADVTLLVGLDTEHAIFVALETLSRGDKEHALFLLHREADGPAGVHPVLTMCAWHLRRLLMFRDAYDRGLRQAEVIASETELKAFVVRQALASLEHLPIARLTQGLRLLSDYDTAFKQGAMEPHVALDLFAWKF